MSDGNAADGSSKLMKMNKAIEQIIPSAPNFSAKK
jgi:hypothetical protein